MRSAVLCLCLLPSADRARAQETSEFVVGVAAAPDGRLYAWGGNKKTATVADGRTGKVLHILSGHTDTIYCLAFRPDGKTLATGADDKTVRLWDTATGKEGLVLMGHTSTVRAVAFAPDGKTLASVAFDKTVRVWDAVTGKQLRVIEDGAFYHLLAYSPDGRFLAGQAVPDDTGVVRVWDPATGKRVHEFPAPPRGLINCVAFSPDSKRLALVTSRGAADVRDLTTGKTAATFELTEDSGYAAAFSPDGKHLAVGDRKGVTRMWDAETGKLVATLTGGHTEGVRAVGFTADGARVFTAGYDKLLRFWDPATGRMLRD